MWSVWLISAEVYEFVNDFENSPIIELFSVLSRKQFLLQSIPKSTYNFTEI